MDQREERSHQAKPHSIYNCSKDGVSPVVEPVDQKVSRKEGTTGEITQLPGGKGSEKRLRNKMQWDQGKVSGNPGLQYESVSKRKACPSLLSVPGTLC